MTALMTLLRRSGCEIDEIKELSSVFILTPKKPFTRSLYERIMKRVLEVKLILVSKTLQNTLVYILN